MLHLVQGPHRFLVRLLDFLFGKPLPRHSLPWGPPLLGRSPAEIVVEFLVGELEGDGAAEDVPGGNEHGLTAHAVGPPDPFLHARPFARILRRQGRFGKDRIEVSNDVGRLGDRLAAMDQGRHHALGVELQVSGIMLFGLLQVHTPALEVDLLLEQAYPHLLRTRRCKAVIELDGYRVTPDIASYRIRNGALIRRRRVSGTRSTRNSRERASRIGLDRWLSG